MKKIVVTLVLLFITVVPVFTQENKMDRIELCKKNYAALFGGEALSGQGTDPEMMDLLQKFIFGEVFQTGNLDIKTREMITCVTLTTMQTLPQLKAHIGASLNIGITPIEVRESILPLEKQGMVNEQNRGTKGAEIQQPLYGDAIKKALKDLPDSLGDDVARFLTEYGFGDIYTRGGLDLKTKELLVYAVITTLEADSQLRSHTLSNIKLGNDKSTLTSVVIQCLPYIGFPAAMKTLRIIQETKEPDTITGSQKVRLAKIVVDQARLNEYNSYLKEEIESSMRLEPGVLTLYATFEKERPNRITILEIYANEEAYQSHIKTPHFLKYKQGTLDMVQELELIDSTPLIEDMKIK
jgi:4-carboxymuconolactone decarboxylase